MATTPIKFMDVRFINPFIVSLVSIFKEMAGLTMEKGTLVKGQGRKLFSGYGVAIGIVGDVNGQVLYEFPENFSQLLTENLTDKKRGEYDFEDMMRSVINEMGNTISGLAITKLAEEGISCDITPPILYFGKEIQIIPKNLQTIIIPFQSSLGFVSVNIAMDA
ncbi:chemotaxis protein CheX [Brachyspira hyodysenteriae]|uniref:chemotaxis protein CheX n=1 Tax=Brachyspira hyodysenteriae TaxID=159 RepID=UPI00063DD6FE|nr:chemotaxis protein CheX [Brachyspira hyodysenteriae]KLI31376.1 chemotaxis protein CheX [Brachyspira hyodysenteriae]MCZ9933430.1 chemotaxis protein CheX [Brachyspira hyodysenteriae]MCZ9996981.1 chemotaxis protein CheX [Brachyspira hyodysenteriae]MDA0053666.1 chemotaxis protein CheX [Brachyspira hyodysenteriae]